MLDVVRRTAEASTCRSPWEGRAGARGHPDAAPGRRGQGLLNTAALARPTEARPPAFGSQCIGVAIDARREAAARARGATPRRAPTGRPRRPWIGREAAGRGPGRSF